MPHLARSSSPKPSFAKPKKAALLIGCRYQDSEFYGQLYQSHNDVFKVKDVLMKQYGYDKSNITVLLDDGKHEPPTKENIVNAMKNLVAGSKAGDRFFFLFSGHGEQTPCAKNDKTEPDGLDEAIVPCDASDYKETWVIDNDMNTLLVRNIPVGAQLIALFDMCHAGTALDLKHYCYNNHCLHEPTVVDLPGAEPADRRDFVDDGATHARKKTSHDTVENETRRLGNLSLSTAETQLNYRQGDAARRKNTRHIFYMSRESSIHAKFSESSGVNSPARLAADEEVMSSQRRHSCVDCGGSVDEYGPAHGSTPEKPNRRRTVNKRFTIVSGAQGRAPSEKEKTFIKRRLSKSGHTTSKDVRNNGLFSRTPTASVTDSSIPTPPPSVPTTVRPTPISERPNRISVPKFVVSGSDPVQDRSHSQYSNVVEDSDMPRCTSPDLMSLSSQESLAYFPVNGGGLVPSSAMARKPPIRSLQYEPQVLGHAPRPGRCKCKRSSGERSEHGQVISIAPASDGQLSWETHMGTFTSTFVEILKREPSPTYASLHRSLQTFLNDVSDEMRRSVDFVKKRMRIKECMAERANRGRQKQKKYRHNSASTSRSRRDSRKSGDETGVYLGDTLRQAIEEANGGPVQVCIIGTEDYMNKDTVLFDP